MKKLWLYEICTDVAYSLINLIHRIKSDHVMIGRSAHVNFRSHLEGYNKIERNSIFSGEIGRYSYIGANSLVVGKVGRFCSIGGNVSFLTSTHPTSKWVSTHPAFFSDKKQCGISFVKKRLFDEYERVDGTKYGIIVGNDVYIGYGATIIAPVTIGDGAVIAAGSVVTKDVPPYAVVAGVSAKTVRYRFSDEDIQFLLNYKWWEKDFEWLQKNAAYFSSIEDFKENC